MSISALSQMPNTVLDTFVFENQQIKYKKLHSARTIETFNTFTNNISPSEIADIYDTVEADKSPYSDNKIFRLLLNYEQSKNKFTYETEYSDLTYFISPIQLIHVKECSTQIPLNNYKWANRERWSALAHLVTSHNQDILLSNLEGSLVETSRFNIFLYDPNSDLVMTPTLQSGCLKGVFREFCLFDKKINLPVLGFKKLIECDFSIEKIAQAELYVGNSVRGIMRAEIL